MFVKMIRKYMLQHPKMFGLNIYEFPRPAVTATMAVINSETNEVLLGLRSWTANAYPNVNSLPGGFVDEGKETVTEAACRELMEEIGLDVTVNDMVLVRESSKPGTDPRCHVVNAVFYTVVNNETVKTLKAGDDIVAISWITLDEALVPLETNLAFNHSTLLVDSILKYKDDVLFAQLLKEHNTQIKITEISDDLDKLQKEADKLEDKE